eukprot:gene17657-19415_t
MSSNEDNARLAGHPPAVKVGGMRVAQHHVHHTEQKPAERAKEEEEFQTEKPAESKEVVVGGAVVKGNKDNPPAAVKVSHSKPMPTHDNRPVKPAHKGQDMRFDQPKKFNS